MGVFNNSALMISALLLMAPFGLVPFSNTFPAVALLLFAIGLLQHDGLCILLGHMANVATAIYFTIIIVCGGAAVLEVVRRIPGTGA